MTITAPALPRRLAAGALPALVLLSLTACGSASPSHAAGGSTFTGHVETVAVGGTTPADLGTDDSAFGLKLLADLCTAAPATNTVLSPASATQALGMLETGAGGATQQALATLLHQPSYSPAVVAAQHARTQQLAGIKGLSTSNHLYEQVGVAPKQQTLDDLATAYATPLQTLDFAQQPAQAVSVINAAVKKDTKGLIPTVLDQAPDPSTVMVLTDAMYLHADWAEPFENDDPAAFTTADGTQAMVPTMTGGQDAGVATAGGWTAAALTYAGGELTAYAILPPSDAKTCAVPSSADLGQLLTAKGHDVPVELPSFHLTSTHQLLSTLAAEGLHTSGDYEGFGADTITQVVQKVDIEVDRTGTTAAAVTGITGAATAAAPVSEPIAFDRPFLFLVTDSATHTPLFLTRVADPRS